MPLETCVNSPKLWLRQVRRSTQFVVGVRLTTPVTATDTRMRQITGVVAPIARHGIISPMCGRYKLSRRQQLVDEYFDTASDETEWTPRYNVAPTQPVPVEAPLLLFEARCEAPGEASIGTKVCLQKDSQGFGVAAHKD
jgi:SOS response associated peptidase (SRAP)